MVSFGSFVEFGIVIYFMTKTVSAVRSESDGFISFANAFKPAWGTFIITTTITTLFTFLLMNYIDPSLKDVVKEIQAEAFEQASGWPKLGESDKEKMMEQLAESDAFDQINSFCATLFIYFSWDFIRINYCIDHEKRATFTNT